jgi:hypothetical protein
MKNYKNNKSLIDTYMGNDDEVNDIVKEFVASIKESVKGARKIIQGKECESLNVFGAEILKRDGIDLGSATFYAGFEDNFTHRQMTIAEIEENLKSKDLKFFKIQYTGNGKCRKFWG